MVSRCQARVASSSAVDATPAGSCGSSMMWPSACCPVTADPVVVVYREPPRLLKKNSTLVESDLPEGIATSGQRAAHQSPATSSR